LIVDLEPLETTGNSNICRVQQWGRVGVEAQKAIEATIGGHAESYDYVDTKPEDSRVTTNVTFNEGGTIGFFQSLILYPTDNSRIQPHWLATMIMDVRWLDIPKARKTGVWRMSTRVGTPREIDLACAYHEETKQLAYTASVTYFDRTDDEGSRWYFTYLCLTYISPQEWDIDRDPRGTFIDTHKYPLGMLFCHNFSVCADLE